MILFNLNNLGYYSTPEIYVEFYKMLIYIEMFKLFFFHIKKFETYTS